MRKYIFQTSLSPDKTSKPMILGNCKFCGKDRELIKAHILPESLYPADERGNRMLLVLDGTGKTTSKKLPSGHYDNKLVCRECENYFQEGDSYANSLFVSGCGKGVVQSTKLASGFQYENIDYKKLKLFFISLLWRAHATSLPAFNQVDIGAKFEAKAKDMIKRGAPGNADEFAVVIIKVAPGPFQKIGVSPTPRRHDRVRVYEFLFFGYLAYVKVDTRPYSDAFRRGQLAPDQALFLPEIGMEELLFKMYAVEAKRMERDTKIRIQNRMPRAKDREG
jgi:hypothetical protein